MRLLHTSDWHLGQTFYRHDRIDEHRRFLAWLLDTLESAHIDALLIAGDVFDHANPPAEAQRQFYAFLSAAKHRLPHLNILVIAGNHDSAARLEAPSPLLDAFDVTVIGSTRRAGGDIDPAHLVVPLKDKTGEITAWCLAIPFLRPSDVPRVDTTQDVYLTGVRQLHDQALHIALSRQQSGQSLLAMGHCHMRGGALSEDSERRILIGGAEAVPVDLYDPVITYAALGHLHRAQSVGDQARVRYSGSPLAMSFTERNYLHQVVCVEIENGVFVRHTPIPVPHFVELLQIPETAAPIDVVLDRLAALDLPDVPKTQQPYLRVLVQTTDVALDTRARVDAVLREKAVRLAAIERERPPHSDADDLSFVMAHANMTPTDLFQRLHHQKHGVAPSADLMEAFQQIVFACDVGEAP